MKEKVNILAKPHPYIFFHTAVRQLLGSYLIATYEAIIPSYTDQNTDTNAGSYSSFPGHVEGARKWPENEATPVKLVNL